MEKDNPAQEPIEKNKSKFSVLKSPKVTPILAVLLMFSLAGNVFQIVSTGNTQDSSLSELTETPVSETEEITTAPEAPEISFSEADQQGADANDDSVDSDTESTEEVYDYGYGSKVLNKKLNYDGTAGKHAITLHKIARDVKVNDEVDKRLIAFYVTIQNLGQNSENYDLSDFRLEEWESYGGEVLEPNRAFDYNGESWSNSTLASNSKKDLVLVFRTYSEGTLEWIPLSLDFDNPLSMPYNEI